MSGQNNTASNTNTTGTTNTNTSGTAGSTSTAGATGTTSATTNGNPTTYEVDNRRIFNRDVYYQSLEDQHGEGAVTFTERQDVTVVRVEQPPSYQQASQAANSQATTNSNVPQSPPGR